MYPWFQNLLATFQHRVNQQQLHHGLLLIAETGIGSDALINGIAQTLVCQTANNCGECKACKLFEASSHPDIKRVVSDKPSIGVDLIREVGEFVTSTSQLLGNKVVIIEDIERMTESASNSLLKTLEEPNNNTYLLLSTSSANSVLPTIKSRCEKINVSTPAASESLPWIKSQTNKAVTKEGLMAFSNRPLEYLESFNEGKLGFEDFHEKFNQLIDKKVHAFMLAESYKDNAAKVVTWAYMLLIQRYQTMLLGKGNHAQSLASTEHDSMQRLAESIDACKQANLKISQAGINKSLLLQKVFNKIQMST